MRVTEALKFGLVSRGLASLQSKYLKTATQAATGQRINAPSDDPNAAAAATRIQSGLAGAETLAKNITTVQGDVEIAESTLAHAGDILQRLKEIALSGANDSSNADQRRILATEVGQLRDQIIGLANTKGSRGYLFSGTLSNRVTLDSSGTFRGNDEQQLVDLGTIDPVAVNVSGARAFTSAGGTDVAQAIADLGAALQSNDTDSIRSSLEAIDQSHDQILNERARAGLLLNRLELSSTLVDQTQLDLAKQQTGVIDADPATTLTNLTQLQAAIGNSLAVGKQLLSLSALDRF